MKLRFLVLSAVAIASYSNVHGVPALVKRLVGVKTTVLGCFAQ